MNWLIFIGKKEVIALALDLKQKTCIIYFVSFVNFYLYIYFS